MRDFLWEVKYELVRTLKHIFYVLLVICWFAFWYAITSIIISEWNIYKWTDTTLQVYWSLTIIWGFGYLMYRIGY